VEEFERSRRRIIEVARTDGERALLWANQLILDYPDRSASWSARAQVFWLLRRYDEALADSDRAISVQPEEPSNYFHKGDYLLKMDDFEKAIELFSQALTQGEAHDLAYYEDSSRMFRAFCYCKTGRFEDALADLALVEDRHPRWIDRLTTRDELIAACHRRHLD
jgi:tetratricopeptide (TPR) repeat protein